MGIISLRAGTSSPSRNTLDLSGKDNGVATGTGQQIADSPVPQRGPNDLRLEGPRDQLPASDKPTDLRGFFVPQDPNNEEQNAFIER